MSENPYEVPDAALDASERVEVDPGFGRFGYEITFEQPTESGLRRFEILE